MTVLPKTMSRTSPKRARLLAFASAPILLVLTFAVALTYFQLRGFGWPDNHEGNSFFTRTTLYTEQFRSGVPVPVWSAIDSAGFGSPQPLLYHKLFYYISGVTFLVTNDIKLAVSLTVILCLFVGGAGVVRLARQLGSTSSLVCGFAGVLFVIGSYTTTLWLYRGAMAELTLSALVPWSLVLANSTLLSNSAQPKQSQSIALGVILGMMFHAHSSVFVAAFYLASISYAVTLGLLSFFGEEPRRRALEFCTRAVRALPWTAAAFAVVVAPIAIPMLKVQREFQTSNITPVGLRPQDNFLKMSALLFDPYVWGQDFPAITFRLDLGIVVGLGVLGMTMMLQRYDLVKTVSRRSARRLHSDLQPRHEPAADLLDLEVPRIRGSLNNIHEISDIRLLFATVMGVGCLALLSPLSTPLYQLPGMQYLQFPWRYLAILTPLLIVILGALASRQGRRPAVAIMAIIVGATLLLGGGFKSNQADRIVPQPTSLDNLYFSFSLFGEYFPDGLQEIPARSDVLARGAPNCEVDSPTGNAEDVDWLFRAECTSASNVTLPIVGTRYHDIYLITDQGSEVRRCDVIKGLCGVRLSSGVTYIEARRPTLRTLWSR